MRDRGSSRVAPVGVLADQGGESRKRQLISNALQPKPLVASRRQSTAYNQPVVPGDDS
jgi:hypothetical protein